jgi:hypothetical protein
MGTIMIIRMMAMTITMRMEMSRVMSIDFRFVPSRVSGTENTVVPMGDF